MSIDLKAVISGRFRFLPPRAFSTVVRLIHGGGFSTFRDPKTYSELIVAKNLTDRNPLIPLTADKLAVREYVAEKIGQEYLVPLVQAVERAEDIDFDRLPSRCVIKGTHGCDMTILLKGDKPVDREAIRTTVRRWLETDFSKVWKEWVYSQIPPRVIIEEFLGEGPEPPADYKFMAFHGRVEALQVHQSRFTDHRLSSFDRDWNPLNVASIYKQSADFPPRPDNLEKMIEIAEKLAADFEFARIDLYDVDGRVYFGEITHVPGAGRSLPKPKEFDLAMGELWRNGTPIPDRFKA